MERGRARAVRRVHVAPQPMPLLNGCSRRGRVAGLGNEKKADMVEAVLADWRTAPIEPKLRAMLGFLEKLTLEPAEVGPADVVPLRAAGLSDAAIEDAIHACVLFNVY